MPDPEGSYALTCDAVRNMVADSETFRALPASKLLTHADAKARTYWEALPPPADVKEYTPAELTAYRPFAVVEAAGEDGPTWTAVADGCWAYNGVISVYIERTCADVTARNVPTADAMEEWRNLVSQIIDDLRELAGESNPIYPRLALENVHFIVGPSHSHPDDAVHEGVSQTVVLGLEFQS